MSSPIVYSYLELIFGLRAAAVPARDRSPSNSDATRTFLALMAPSVHKVLPAPRSESGGSGTRSSCHGFLPSACGRSARARRRPPASAPARDRERETIDGGCLPPSFRGIVPPGNPSRWAPGAPARRSRLARMRSGASSIRIRRSRRGESRTREPRGGRRPRGIAPRSLRERGRARGSSESPCAVPEQREERQAEHDPVPTEGLEAVAGEVAQERTDRDRSDDRRNAETDGHGRGPDRGTAQERLPAFHEVEEGRRAEGREREQERKLRRRDRGASQKEARQDRHHGS